VALYMKAQQPTWQIDLLVEMLMGALIGIGTNWIAIMMLFRPSRPILGLQGVIPANREKLIEELSHGVATKLLDPETIRRAVHESEVVGRSVEELLTGIQRLAGSRWFQQDVATLLRSYVQLYFSDPGFRREVIDVLSRIASALPREMQILFAKPVAELLEQQVTKHQAEILEYFEDAILAYIENCSEVVVAVLVRQSEDLQAQRAEIEKMISEAAATRIAQMDIAAIVKEKLTGFDANQLEGLILAATDRHLAKVQYFGWILGLVLGPTPRLLQIF
jgi:uncharacterized membrane protein YheB (UPF0754 family)